MPKRIKQDKRPSDISQLAHHLVDLSTHHDNDAIEPPTKAQVSLFMAELGRKGGKIGGKRRLQTMTAKQRSKIAKKAAQARWKQN
jgi:hypothetical protein